MLCQVAKCLFQAERRSRISILDRALTVTKPKFAGFGPLKVFDVSGFEPGRTVEVDLYTYDDDRPINADSALGRAAPVHEVFLSRRIPIYEELFNLDRLLNQGSMLFTDVPLNIENGDGMMVRPVVFVY